jgi:hypothetical protein
LENVLQKAGTFTTSMALKTTIAWKTYKSLLSVNTPNFTSNYKSKLPSHEPICMARKPLEKGMTVAENCLKHGVGGINVDGSRVEAGEDHKKNCNRESVESHWRLNSSPCNSVTASPLGRFPANLIHDGSEEVRECFPEA